MPLTLLFDLDDTLLINPIDVFQKEYFKLLGAHLQPYISAEKMLPSLLRATQAMLDKSMPAVTLENTFDDSFYAAINIPKSEIISHIEQFYKDKFPQLKKLTGPQPGAKHLLDYAFQQGWRVVIATNPLFPQTAIYQRLEWAGFPTSHYPFSLITTYENTHFSKPHPAYYYEILAQLGWPDSPIVMVGNSLTDDILPAAKAGFSTYYLSETDPLRSELNSKFNKTGKFTELQAFLDVVAREALAPTIPGTPDMLLEVIKSTPAALDTLIKPITPAGWKCRPEPKEWSLTEIICHLSDVDQEVNLPRIARILSEDAPFLAGIISDTWAEERDYQSQSGSLSFSQFLTARTRLIKTLLALQPSDWNKPARHAIFGPTSLIELVGFMVQHDRVHIQQAIRTFHAIREE